MKDSSITVIVTVSSISDRDRIIKNLYTNLTKEPQTTFTIQQDQVNRIKIFHNVGRDNRVLIKTYLVIVIPILIDLKPITSAQGVVDFKLDETIESLQKLINKLQGLQGRHIMKGSSNAATFAKLVDCLRETTGEY